MKLIGFLGLITLAVACGANDAGPGDDGKKPGGGSKATEEEISACKKSCDQLKFFQCNDSLDQAACYANCSSATSDQIELFNACVTNDTCDATCSTHIQPPPDTTGSGNPTGGSGGGSSTCASDGCGPGGDPVEAACHDACQQLQFFMCIDADTFTTCNSLCMSAETTKKQTFASCVQSGSIDKCQAVDCYYQFDPSAMQGPTPQQIADCKKACQDLGFFDCITGAEAADCAAQCDAMTKDTIEAFLICTSDPTDCATAATCF